MAAVEFKRHTNIQMHRKRCSKSLICINVFNCYRQFDKWGCVLRRAVSAQFLLTAVVILTWYSTENPYTAPVGVTIDVLTPPAPKCCKADVTLTWIPYASRSNAVAPGSTQSEKTSTWSSMIEWPARSMYLVPSPIRVMRGWDESGGRRVVGAVGAFELCVSAMMEPNVCKVELFVMSPAHRMQTTIIKWCKKHTFSWIGRPSPWNAHKDPGILNQEQFMSRQYLCLS